MNKNSLWREEIGDFGSPVVVKERDEEKKPMGDITKEAALALTSLASLSEAKPSHIATHKHKKNGVEYSPRLSHLCSVFESEYQHEVEFGKTSTINQNVLNSMLNERSNRIRTVSVDSSSFHPLAQPLPLRRPPTPTVRAPYECLSDYLNGKTTDSAKERVVENMKSISNSLPNVEIRQNKRRHQQGKQPLCPRKKYCQRRQQSGIKSSTLSRTAQNVTTRSKILLQPDLPESTTGENQVKTILRRKFSWKNYPELETFLIANREEYLRHSALNYTVQQKQYNNLLTNRLLELASKHGYVFDKEAFSFVTVRDRIRCYYKSYVQSSKKRGLIIGYAARKAGLLSEDDLEKSAGMLGRVVVPD